MGGFQAPEIQKDLVSLSSEPAFQRAADWSSIHPGGRDGG